jgi:hypothetical protein
MTERSETEQESNRIAWWTRQHAIIMIIGIGSTLIEPSGLLLAAMAGASWLGLIRISRAIKTDQPTPLGFRALTGVRVLIALGLISELIEPALSLPLTGLLLALCLLESFSRSYWPTRSSTQTLREQEADNLTLLSLLIALAHLTSAGKITLILGLIRPVFALAAYWNPPPPAPMPQRNGDTTLITLALWSLASLMIPSFPHMLEYWVLSAATILWVTPYARWALSIKRAQTLSAADQTAPPED